MQAQSFIKYIISFKPDYTPFSPYIREDLFINVEERLLEVFEWDVTVKIPKEEFEKWLHNNQDLADTYVELYSEDSTHFETEMEVGSELYEFYIMVQNERMSLIYYRQKLDGDKEYY